MNHELIIAASLGLIGGVIPGPVITAVFTEILQSGFRKSLRIIFIAFLTESAVAVVSLLLFAWVDPPEWVFRSLSVAGALILFWMAGSIWKIRNLESGEMVSFSLWKLLLMILSNGVLWTYWITICIPKAMLLDEDLRLGAFVFMGLVQMGWLLSTMLLAFFFSRFRPLLTKPRVIPLFFKLFSLAFVYFALDMLIKSIRFFYSLP